MKMCSASLLTKEIKIKATKDWQSQDIKQLKHSFAAGGNVKWYNQFGEFGTF